MACAITIRKAHGALVVDLSGRLTLGDSTLDLRDSVRQSLEAGHRAFVLNLAAVSYMDSAGLGQVVSTYTSVRKKGGHVVLLSPTERTEHLLQIAGLVTVFDTYDDEARAVAALSEA